jgi:glycosyltransferase involved in cell wall biosynthesis
MTTTVSIIVPTYNRLQRLQAVIAALEHQDYPLSAMEVLIVSDGSTDGTHEYLHHVQTPLQFKWIAQANSGPAAARNRGIAEAGGEFVVFIDDDVLPIPQLVSEHMRVHQAADRDLVVLGPMLSPTDFTMMPWVRWEQTMLMKQYQAMERGDWVPTARQFYTGNTSLRRCYIQEAGGFNEQFRRAEDIELAFRLDTLGLEFVFQPAAIGWHYAERSLRSWLEIPSAYGRNDVIFARSCGQDWIWNTTRRELRQRHLLIRWLVRLCNDRFAMSALAETALLRLARLSNAIGVERLTQQIYSGLFNLRYYRGFSQELGDPHFIFSAPDTRTPPSRPV